MKVFIHKTIRESKHGTKPEATPADVRSTIGGWQSEFRPGNIVLDEARRVWLVKDKPHGKDDNGPDQSEGQAD